MKKNVLREYLKNREGFMVYLNEKGEPETVKESLENMGIKINVQEPTDKPNRETRRKTKKGEK